MAKKRIQEKLMTDEEINELAELMAKAGREMTEAERIMCQYDMPFYATILRKDAEDLIKRKNGEI
jgi:hypothetical protein